MWAILSGIEGNISAYQAVLKDISCQKSTVEDIYILGDVIGLSPDNQAVINAITNSSFYLTPHVCRGWWEEQCLILHGLSSVANPEELIDKYGMEATKELWDCVPRSMVEWIRGLDFGFVEFDCLLIHGTSVSVSETLTPESSPWMILDRLQRMNVNYLFSGRSSLLYEYQLRTGSLNSTVITLDNQTSDTREVKKKKIIGVGNVGKIPHQASYILYNPYNDQLKLQSIKY